MKKYKIFIDGQSGTTGLEIADRLKERDDLELITIDYEKRHDESERKACMERADLVFLCLPDDQARIAAGLCPENTPLIDTSTAHRTAWTYGFADLDQEHYQSIQNGKRIANPGCHATGVISLLYPLQKSGLLKKDAVISACSLTGYTGGGKKMIADYEQNKKENMQAPKPYGLTLSHKHMPEIKKQCDLQAPFFLIPVVDDYPRGMLCTIVIPKQDFEKEVSLEDLRALYRDWYQNRPLISLLDKDADPFYAADLAGLDALQIQVNGSDEGVVLQACFDNLGKGASGAAIQNMNIVLGLEETSGLKLHK